MIDCVTYSQANNSKASIVSGSARCVWDRKLGGCKHSNCGACYRHTPRDWKISDQLAYQDTLSQVHVDNMYINNRIHHRAKQQCIRLAPTLQVGRWRCSDSAAMSAQLPAGHGQE